MKSTAINTLRYSGIVTISRYIKQKKIKLAQVKNTGGQSLFNFFSECLAGDYRLAEVYRPAKILLLKYEEILDGGVSKLTVSPASDNFVHLLAKPEKVYNTSASTVRYSFIVSGDMLQSTRFNGIGLYPESATLDTCKDFAAFCRVDELEDVSISPSSILVVDWELNVLNKIS